MSAASGVVRDPWGSWTDAHLLRRLLYRVHVTSFDAIAPILPTRNVPAALARYSRLGFDVDPFGAGDDSYSFIRLGEVWLHLSRMDDVDPNTTVVSVYTYVSDADALHAEWSTTEVEGNFHQPTDTEYGLREGAYVDPDGNLLRYGSWLNGPPTNSE